MMPEIHYFRDRRLKFGRTLECYTGWSCPREFRKRRSRVVGMHLEAWVIKPTKISIGALTAVNHFIITTTFPLARPLSTYSNALPVCSKGNTLSTTGLITPDSTSLVICAN